MSTRVESSEQAEPEKGTNKCRLRSMNHVRSFLLSSGLLMLSKPTSSRTISILNSLQNSTPVDEACEISFFQPKVMHLSKGKTLKTRLGR